MTNQYKIEEGMIGLIEQYIIWNFGLHVGHLEVGLVSSLNGAVTHILTANFIDWDTFVSVSNVNDKYDVYAYKCDKLKR